MNLLLVFDGFGPGGDLAVCMDLYMALKSKGISVRVVAVRRPAVEDLVAERFKSRQIPVMMINRICPSEIKNIRLLDDSDVVHIHNPGEYLPLKTALQYRRAFRTKPIVVTLHGPRPVKALSATTREKWSARLGSRLVDHLIIPSQHRTQDLQSLGVHPRRIKTIGNPIRSFKKLDRQTARLALNLKDDRFTILWLGRMCEEKAPQLLVEAAPYLRQSGLDPLFLYAGIPYENIHEAFYPLAEKLGAKVMFLGYLADPSPAYFASDVYCLTSKFENFPIVLFEALATGLPSVSPQLPIVENELNNHYGLYTYHREEIETLSDAILKVHDEPIIDKAKISIDTLEKFGYDRTAQQHIDLYQYLLNS